MPAPVYLYYQLDNFYQNHRKYIGSKNSEQLKGSWPVDLTSCEPVTLNKHVKANLENKNKIKLNEDDIANPCGLVARTYFTDSY